MSRKLEEKLDELFSQYIRLQFSDWRGYARCYTCTAILHWRAVDCGHFIRRGNHSVRWDRRNGRPQCIDCNRFGGGKEKSFEENLRAELGDKEVDDLIRLGRESFNPDDVWLKREISVYKSLVEKLWKG